MSQAKSRSQAFRRWLIAVLVVLFLAAGGYGVAQWSWLARSTVSGLRVLDDRQRPMAPELDGGVAWLNTAAPLRLSDLRGKIVLLDFWTFCCINCIHTLPDLAKLEKKYANELVVIGVHSAKFDNEKNTESIRKAVLRYEIDHPVVNDADMKIWRRYRVESWPTLVLDRPRRAFVAYGSGEGLYDARRRNGRQADRRAPGEEDAQREAAALRVGPRPRKGRQPAVLPRQGAGRRRATACSSPTARTTASSLPTLKGKKIAVAGTGKPGNDDGPFDKAQLQRPAGHGAAWTTRSTSPTARTTSSAPST